MLMEKANINLLITGDFCPIGRVKEYLDNDNIATIFEEFKPYTEDQDLVITNLECPVTNSETKITKTGPALKSDPKSIQLLREGGFNLVNLANNHIYDYGYDGLKDTLDHLKNGGIDYLGAGLTKEEVVKPFIYTKNGFKIAILNFCENEWSTIHQDHGANPIDAIKNYNSIKKISAEVDRLIVISHGGHELFPYPSPKMKALFRFYVDAGADAVINHHTHYFSGYEIYNEAPIFYSLGNFLFDNQNTRDPLWHRGLAVQLSLSEDKLDFDIISFEQCKDKVGISINSDSKHADTIDEINLLNEVIADEDLLDQKFKDHVSSKTRQYLAYLEPHSNKYLFALQNRKLFPRLLKRKKKVLLCNLVRCESHREAIIEILNDENSHS